MCLSSPHHRQHIDLFPRQLFSANGGSSMYVKIDSEDYKVRKESSPLQTRLSPSQLPKWDPSEHPRVPAGSGDPSGEFTESGSGGDSGSSSEEPNKKFRKLADVSEGVRKMVGDGCLMEYDTGQPRLNAVPPTSPLWGSKPGIYTVYRAGNLDRNIVFTANTFKGAEEYASAFSEEGDIDPLRAGVTAYTVELKNPYRSRNIQEAYQDLFGKDVNDLRDRSADGWTKADNKIRGRLNALGYDAWVMSDPAPPADKEMNIFNPKKSKMTPIAFKLPEETKTRWEGAVDSGGYYKDVFDDGDRIMTYEQWESKTKPKVHVDSTPTPTPVVDSPLPKRKPGMWYAGDSLP
jgi:hypothetical protein